MASLKISELPDVGEVTRGMWIVVERGDNGATGKLSLDFIVDLMERVAALEARPPASGEDGGGEGE